MTRLTCRKEGKLRKVVVKDRTRVERVRPTLHHIWGPLLSCRRWILRELEDRVLKDHVQSRVRSTYILTFFFKVPLNSFYNQCLYVNLFFLFIIRSLQTSMNVTNKRNTYLIRNSCEANEPCHANLAFLLSAAPDFSPA